MKHAGHTTRREFISITGGVLAALVGAPSLAVTTSAAQATAQAGTAGGRDPDAIVINATVYTMDSRAPRAEAFAVTNGRFTAVGSTNDIKGLAG